MAEPTLKDVLKAISELRTETSEIRSEMATKTSEIRSGMATKAALEAMRAEMATKAALEAMRAEMTKGFADLDKELTGHADLHREIEKDIEALKRRPARTAARSPRRPRTR
jgi:hypothetical protein